MDIPADSHWTPHWLHIGLGEQNLASLSQSKMLVSEIDQQAISLFLWQTHLVAQPLDIILRQLFAVTEMRNPLILLCDIYHCVMNETEVRALVLITIVEPFLAAAVIRLLLCFGVAYTVDCQG
jgi:hypothetical protein